jgi:transposase
MLREPTRTSEKLSKKSPGKAGEAQGGSPEGAGGGGALGRGRGSAGSKAGDEAGVWAPVGKRPLARFKRGYKWTYLYGFVRPQSGEVFWLILPTVNTELFSMALSEFAKEVGAGKDKRVLLVVDKAGWHTGGELDLPEGIHLEFLPSGSPELMPAERLWPLTNEAVANQLFEEIEELEEALVERCVQLLEQTETIRDLTNYHWWPQAA